MTSRSPSSSRRRTSRPSNAPPPEQPRRLDRPVDRKKGTTPPCRPLQAHQPARTYIRHCPRAAGNPGCVGRIGSLAVPSLVRLAPLGVRQAAGQRWRRDRPSHWGDTHAQHDCGLTIVCHTRTCPAHGRLCSIDGLRHTTARASRTRRTDPFTMRSSPDSKTCNLAWSLIWDAEPASSRDV